MSESNKEHSKSIDKRKTSLSIVIILTIVFIFIIIVIRVLFPFKNKQDDDFFQIVKEKGFTDLNEHFVCDAIKNNSTLIMSTRKYSFIAIDGDVYNISFSSSFNENQNCEKRDFTTKLKSHIDDIVIGEDNKYYSVYDNLSLNEKTSLSFETKDVLQKVDRYILKKDGNVYKIDGKKLLLKYKKSSFEGKIQSISLINLDYDGEDEKKIIVLTDKAIYYSYSENEKECRKYANKKCSYIMKKDDFLSKYRNIILYVDDTILITKEGKVLYTNKYWSSK